MKNAVNPSNDMSSHTLQIKEFSICYVTTFAIPAGFGKQRVLYDNEKAIAGLSDHLRKRLGVCAPAENMQCWSRKVTGAGGDSRASCSCFYEVDNFLKTPDKNSEYYCERFRLARLTTSEGMEVDFIAAVYYRLGYVDILVNLSSRNSPREASFTVDDIIRCHDLMGYSKPDCNAFDAASVSNRDFELFAQHVRSMASQPVDRESLRNAVSGDSTVKGICCRFARFIQFFTLEYNARCTSPNALVVSDRDWDSYLAPYVESLGGEEYTVRDYGHTITEIKRLADTRSIAVDDSFIALHSRELYGALTRDEGYRFVPEATAQQALSVNWGTRYFVRAFIFGNSMLVMNLKPDDYVESQKEQCRKIFVERRPDYYALDSCIAGLDHCFLENIEKACLSQYSIRLALVKSKKLETPPQSNIVDYIEETSLLRQNILRIINKSYMNTKELNIMLRLVYEEKGIFADIEDMKYTLDRHNDDLTFDYDKLENNNLKILTLATVATALVVGIFTLNVRAYEPVGGVVVGYTVASLLVGGWLLYTLYSKQKARKKRK